MKEPKKLYQWSLICLLSTTALDNLLTFRWPAGTLSLVMPGLLIFLLLILPGIGTVLGAMSLRKEGRTGLLIVLVGVNILLALLGLYRLILFLSGEWN